MPPSLTAFFPFIYPRRPFVVQNVHCAAGFPIMRSEDHAGFRCAFRDATMKKINGFTLIELMLAVTVFAILLAVGIPSFSRIVEDNRVVTQMNDLTTAFARARSEAVTRGVPVRVSAATGDDGQDFNEGWCVHTRSACAADTSLLMHEPLKAGVNLALQDDLTWIEFDRLGRATSDRKGTGGGAIRFTLAPSTCNAGETRARTLDIMTNGRPVAANKQACP